MRRTRQHPWTRALVSESRLAASDLIWPVFIAEGEGKRDPIPSMPGVMRRSVDTLVAAVREG